MEARLRAPLKPIVVSHYRGIQWFPDGALIDPPIMSRGESFRRLPVYKFRTGAVIIPPDNLDANIMLASLLTVKVYLNKYLSTLVYLNNYAHL